MTQTVSKPWYVYILECSDGTYYTGSTVAVTHRVLKHNQGVGAKYTRSRLPVKLIYIENHDTHSSALKREAAIKHLTRLQKKQLVAQKK